MESTQALHPLVTLLTAIGCFSMVALTVGMIVLLVKNAGLAASVKALEAMMSDLKASVAKLFERFERGDCAKHSAAIGILEAAVTRLSSTEEEHRSRLDAHRKALDDHGQRIAAMEQK